MRSLLLGIVLGVSIVFAGGYLYFSRGYAPVATAAPPMPFEATLARLALRARIAKEAPTSAPIPADDANLLAGANVYREQCAVCHGLSRQTALTSIAKGMSPKPPQLFQGHGVTGDPVGETYWKVKNGIRMTGMPGFVQSLTDQQLWQVSLMLAQADKLQESARKLITQ